MAKLLKPVDFISNVETILDHFGEWPSFHDSEIVAIRLHRSLSLIGGPPTLEVDIHVFSWNTEGDRYRFERHCVITLGFSDVCEIKLEDFNQQNVLSDLVFEKNGLQEVPYRCTFVSSHGVEGGFVFSSAIVLGLEPGLPEGSNYGDASRSPKTVPAE